MGSKLGWIIAGGLLVAVIVVVLVLVVSPSVSGPVATARPGVLEMEPIEVSLRDVLGEAEPAQEGNAADDYAKAAELYRANKDELAMLRGRLPGLVKAETPEDAALTTLQLICSHVVSGARRKKMQYVLVHEPKALRVGYSCPVADDMYNLANQIRLLAHFHVRRREFEPAERALQAQWMLGWHLVDERALPATVMAGVEILDSAAKALRSVYRTLLEQAGDPADAKLAQYANRVKLLGELDMSLTSARHALIDKKKIVWNVNPEPGDIFNVAQNDHDRAWQVQAILALGLVKFTADREADVRHTKQLLAAFRQDPDPLKAAAAKAAQDLTEADFNQLGRGM